MYKEIILLIGAYLLGSFPYMLILSRLRGFDLSQEPDYHIAMYRKVGRLEGLSGIAVDLLKGIIPVLVGFYLNLDVMFVASAAFLAVFGQMWPVFQKFNGEKGNTTGLGAAGALTVCYNLIWVLLAGIVFMLIGFLVRTVPRFLSKDQTFREKLGFGGPASNSLPLGMILGFAFMPLTSFLLSAQWQITLALLIIFIAIIIRRLTAGIKKDIRERRISAGRILFNRLLFDRSYY